MEAFSFFFPDWVVFFVRVMEVEVVATTDVVATAGTGFNVVATVGAGFDVVATAGTGFDVAVTAGTGFDVVATAGMGFDAEAAVGFSFAGFGFVDPTLDVSGSLRMKGRFC